MTRTIKISDHETLEFVHDDAEALELIATFTSYGSKPPAHLHPHQIETFEVLCGTLTVESSGETDSHPTSSVFTIKAGVSHRMWNAAGEECRVRWTTTPRLSTPEWFEGLGRIQERAESGVSGFDRLLGFARLARENRQTFRPVIAGSPVLGALITILLTTVARIVGTQRSARSAD